MQSYRHWLKVTISLMVVMGIAWIGNLLFFNIHLLFIAYIMTIFIAGQGIIIFILFVLLSKQVANSLAVDHLLLLIIKLMIMAMPSVANCIILFSLKVREAYLKWWKIKHSQSEFLSKNHPTKGMSTSVSVLIAITTARPLLHRYMYTTHAFTFSMHILCMCFGFEYLSDTYICMHVCMHPY